MPPSATMQDFTIYSIGKVLEWFNIFSQAVILALTSSFYDVLNSAFNLITEYLPDWSVLTLLKDVILWIYSISPINHMSLLEMMLALALIYIVFQFVSWLTDIAS